MIEVTEHYSRAHWSHVASGRECTQNLPASHSATTCLQKPPVFAASGSRARARAMVTADVTGEDWQYCIARGGGAARIALWGGGTRRFAPSYSVSGLVLIRALGLC